MTVQQLKNIIISHKYHVPFILIIANCSIHLQPHIHVIDKSRVKQEGAVPVSGKQTLRKPRHSDLATMCLSCCLPKTVGEKGGRNGY